MTPVLFGNTPRGYRTHGEYLDEAIRRTRGRCVRRTPPWGISDARVEAILAAAHPDNAGMIKRGCALGRWYINKGFSVVRLDAEAPSGYGVLYKHDGVWYWYRADAEFVRNLSIPYLKVDKIREDFPELFEEVKS